METDTVGWTPVGYSPSPRYTAEGTNNGTSYKCPNCYTRCATLEYVTEHISTDHLEYEPYSCCFDGCTVRRCSREKLAQHIRAKHHGPATSFRYDEDDTKRQQLHQMVDLLFSQYHHSTQGTPPQQSLIAIETPQKQTELTHLQTIQPPTAAFQNDAGTCTVEEKDIVIIDSPTLLTTPCKKGRKRNASRICSDIGVVIEKCQMSTHLQQRCRQSFDNYGSEQPKTKHLNDGTQIRGALSGIEYVLPSSGYASDNGTPSKIYRPITPTRLIPPEEIDAKFLRTFDGCKPAWLDLRSVLKSCKNGFVLDVQLIRQSVTANPALLIETERDDVHFIRLPQRGALALARSAGDSSKYDTEAIKRAGKETAAVANEGTAVRFRRFLKAYLKNLYPLDSSQFVIFAGSCCVPPSQIGNTAVKVEMIPNLVDEPFRRAVRLAIETVTTSEDRPQDILKWTKTELDQERKKNRWKMRKLRLARFHVVS